MFFTAFVDLSSSERGGVEEKDSGGAEGEGERPQRERELRKRESLFPVT